MADRVVLFENVAGLGKGYLQGISPGDVLLAGGFRFGTSSITIDGSGNIVGAGNNITVSSAADFTLSAGDDLILSAVDSILLTGSPITALSYFTTTATSTKAAVRIGMVAGDPSTLSDGDLWYNTTTAKFRKRENGISSNFGGTSEAATLVVHPTPGVGDYTDIQTALNNLPAGGGLIFVREGTYAITTTISIPTGKDIMIVGCGRENTIIDMDTNLIAAFTIQDQKNYSFADFSIHGRNLAGQIGFESTAPTNLDPSRHVFMRGLRIGNNTSAHHLETALKKTTGSAEFNVDMLDCVVWAAATTPMLFDLSGTGSTLSLLRCQTLGGLTASVTLHATDSTITVSTVAPSAASVRMDNCSWSSGLFTVSGESTFAECTFAFSGVGKLFLTSSASRSRISACHFSGAVARHVDIDTGVNFVSVLGCAFESFTTEAVRTAGQNGAITNNTNCVVTETGAANSNRFIGILSTSTVIGADSTVEGVKRFDVVGASTTGSFVTQFTHTNPKGVVGIGTIKNTGGTNSLEVKETVIDAFGITDSATTTVAFGDSYLLDPQTNFNTARPPHVSYKVEVRHPTAVTTFTVHHATEGAL